MTQTTAVQVGMLTVAALTLLTTVIALVTKLFKYVGEKAVEWLDSNAAEVKEGLRESRANREALGQLNLTLRSMNDTMARLLDKSEDHDDRIQRLENEREVERRVAERLEENEVVKGRIGGKASTA